MKVDSYLLATKHSSYYFNYIKELIVLAITIQPTHISWNILNRVANTLIIRGGAPQLYTIDTSTINHNYWRCKPS